MNIAVFFLCVLLKTCLICHKEVVKTLRPLFTELSHFISFFKHFSAINDVFILIKICHISLVLKTR